MQVAAFELGPIPRPRLLSWYLILRRLILKESGQCPRPSSFLSFLPLAAFSALPSFFAPHPPPNYCMILARGSSFSCPSPACACSFFSFLSDLSARFGSSLRSEALACSFFLSDPFSGSADPKRFSPLLRGRLPRPDFPHTPCEIRIQPRMMHT